MQCRDLHALCLLLLFAVAEAVVDHVHNMPRVTDLHYTRERRLELKEAVHEMFQHAWDGYMRHAWPADELMPLSCRKNDNFGGYALTVIDSLDTLVMFGNLAEFSSKVQWIVDNVRFENLNRKVSVFETNIRIMGGLLSGHLLAEKYMPPWQYNGGLLRLARDLAIRLLPAFDTPTAVPYNEINLMHGVNHAQGHATCPAAAGTLLLEFGLLGVLTGECYFIEAAHRGMEGIWRFRSQHNLVGTILDIYTGKWAHGDADIGASHDSFFEYMLKAYIMFDDDTWLDKWEVALDAANRHLHGPGNWFTRRNCETLSQSSDGQMNSLQAFWPGLLVLYGDIESAVLAFRPFECLFQQLGLIPEEFRVNAETIGGAGYPLRPEMIESAWLLHRATGDPHYLKLGEELMLRINTTARTRCGFAAVKDVRNGRLEDKMDSYVLSETFKYLYLLFDPDPNQFVDMNSGGYVLNTEAHPFPVKKEYMDIYKRCLPFPTDCHAHPGDPRCYHNLKYSKRHKAFFDPGFQRFPKENYAVPHLQEWQQLKMCPVRPHYMKIAGHIHDDGPCFLSQHRNTKPPAPPEPSTEQPQAEQPAPSNEVLIPNGKDYGWQLRVQVAGVKTDVRDVPGGAVVGGLNTAMFESTGDAQFAFLSVWANKHPRDVERNYRCLLRWVGKTAYDMGVAVGEQHDLRYGSTAQKACIETSSERCALEVVKLLLEPGSIPFFRTAPPSDVLPELTMRAAQAACLGTCHASATKAKQKWPHVNQAAVTESVREVLSELDAVVKDAYAKAVEALDEEDVPCSRDPPLPGLAKWPRAADLKREAWPSYLSTVCQQEDSQPATPQFQFVMSTADFGSVPRPSDPHLRSPVVVLPAANSNGCLKMDFDAVDVSGKVVVVTRGQCWYWTKAMHAQEAGAVAVVVISHKPYLERMKPHPNYEKETIHIPVYLMNNENGRVLLALLENDSDVTVEVWTVASASLTSMYFRLGVVSDDTPYGLAAYRYNSTDDPLPALAGSVEEYERTQQYAELRKAEQLALEGHHPLTPNIPVVDDSHQHLKAPREESIVALRYFQVAKDHLGDALRGVVQRCQQSMFNAFQGSDGWLFDHQLKDRLETSWWQITGWIDLLHATAAQPKPRLCGEWLSTPVDVYGTVERVYHQPAGVSSAVVLLGWFTKEGGSGPFFIETIDLLQPYFERTPGYLSREVVQLLSPAHVHGGTSNWVDISVWQNASAVQHFRNFLNDEGGMGLHSWKESVEPANFLDSDKYDVLYIEFAAQNTDTMPQHPLAEYCDSTWSCVLSAE